MADLSGQVVAAFSRRFLVETAAGILPCQVRGRHLKVVCGDRVDVRREGDAGVIEAVQPRSSLLYRSDAFKTKAIAANVTQLAVVVAPRPSFSPELVQRCLLAAEDQGIKSLLVLNKTDLPETPAALERLAPLVRIGYPLVELSALTDVAPLRPALHGHTTLLIGQSGMGKSTILNALCPHARARIGDVSDALGSGRHTTTETALFMLPGDADGWIVDSPGMKVFGIAHADPAMLPEAFVEMRPLLGRCRFRDCRHDREPGCAVRDAVDDGRIAPQRLALLHALRREAESARDKSR